MSVLPGLVRNPCSVPGVPTHFQPSTGPPGPRIQGLHHFLPFAAAQSPPPPSSALSHHILQQPRPLPGTTRQHSASSLPRPLLVLSAPPPFAPRRSSQHCLPGLARPPGSERGSEGDERLQSAPEGLVGSGRETPGLRGESDQGGPGAPGSDRGVWGSWGRLGVSEERAGVAASGLTVSHGSHGVRGGSGGAS